MTESIIPTNVGIFTHSSRGLLTRAYRKGVLKALSGIREGKIILIDGDQLHQFGEMTDRFPIQARVTVQHPLFYKQVLLGGGIGASEAYMSGYWQTDNLTSLVRIILRNRMVMEHVDGSWAKLTEPLHRWVHFLRRNTRRGSRENIAAHYDLGNDFYEVFLDPTMTYSSGIFESANSTLEEASLAKYDRICRKLDLTPDDHVIEIGSGWGGFAIYAAKHYGCRITTTTISKKQYALARQRIREAGLSERIEILLQDYRDLTGEYDKLVSIEMIEAVGHQFYDTFFRACSRLLKPDGLAAIQAITIADHAFDQHKRSVDFIKRYIFPGSCIPSVTALNQSAAKVSDLRLFHLEDITPHCAETLRNWRRNFENNLDRVRKLGYPETFIRMWKFYLHYCEAGFEERYIGDVQMVFSKPQNRRAPILPVLKT